MAQTTDTPAESITYHLDAEDRIVWVSPDWGRFAEANDAAELADTAAVIGQRIWPFIDGLTERSLYQQFFDLVRNAGKPIRIPLRCDSPTHRRHLELQIGPLDDDDGLAICSHTLRIEPRPTVVLLDRRTVRSQMLVDICSFCLKVRSGNDWIETEQAVRSMRLFGDGPAPQLSHGVCPVCLPELYRRLNITPGP
ncbi:hypothetical protein HED60_14320 [Planctomycetales bacterium ZRK34]|nr:hypothetical protein HED60_14320 [Planctomycetales bacterium ZRK34]